MYSLDATGFQTTKKEIQRKLYIIPQEEQEKTNFTSKAATSFRIGETADFVAIMSHVTAVSLGNSAM